MAFPIIPIAAGASALLPLLFGGNKESLPPPEFFGNQFDEILARSRQRTQAQYGNILNDIREYYGNLGLLGNQGALADAGTKAAISKGQDIQNQDFQLQAGEYDRQKAFEVNRYLTQFQSQVNRPTYMDQLLQLLPAVGAFAGNYYGKKNSGPGYDSKDPERIRP